MKKIALTLLLIFAMVTLFFSLSHTKHPRVVATGNTRQAVIPFQPGQYQCAQCKMPIQTQKFSAEVVIKNGKTWFFDDIGCMALWLGNQPFRKSATVWVYTLDTRRWINGRQAWYTQWAQTPMGYGFAALQKRAKHTVRLNVVINHMLNGENLTNRAYAKALQQKMERK